MNGKLLSLNSYPIIDVPTSNFFHHKSVIYNTFPNRLLWQQIKQEMKITNPSLH